MRVAMFHSRSLGERTAVVLEPSHRERHASLLAMNPVLMGCLLQQGERDILAFTDVEVPAKRALVPTLFDPGTLNPFVRFLFRHDQVPPGVVALRCARSCALM